jgi:WD40 repeat protein
LLTLLLALTLGAPAAESLPAGAVARLGSARFRYDGITNGPVAFSPDRKLLAAGHTRGVSVFDVATGRRTHTFPIPDRQSPKAVRFLNEGKRLAVGSRGQEVAELTIYTLADGKAVANYKFTGTNMVQVVDVTADGTRAIVNDMYGRGVFLWDLAAKKELWLFEVSEFANVGRLTADGAGFGVSYRRKIELRDARIGQVKTVYPDPGPTFGNLYGATVADDGRAIASDANRAGSQNSIAVLDPKAAVTVRTFAPTPGLWGHPVMSPDGRYLIGLGQTASWVWDLSAKDGAKPIARLSAGREGAFSLDSKTLALDDAGVIVLYSARDWKALPQSADPPSAVDRVRFTGDGKQIVGHTRGGWVSWPTAGGPTTRLSTDTAVRGMMSLADVSADGWTAVESAYEPGEVWEKGKSVFVVTDIRTGRVRSVPRESPGAFVLRISPDGRFVATEPISPGRICVSDLNTGRLTQDEPSPPGSTLLEAVPAADGKKASLTVCATYLKNGFTPDGPRYAAVTVTDHGTGRKWNIDPVPWSIDRGGARFSPDGSRLILQARYDRDSRKNDVLIWDVRTGRRLMTWNRQTERTDPAVRFVHADSVALSRDNRSLLIGDADGKLALVEVATGGERVSFCQTGDVVSASVSPDGSRAVSSSPVAPVYVWDLLGNPGPWNAAKADAVWTDLASADAKTAFVAIRLLRKNPGEAVPFLRDRIKVPTGPAADTVTELIKRLDAPSFAVREQAQKELTANADLVRPKLEEAKKTASEEVRRRVDEILKDSEKFTPEQLRQVRVCEVVEAIGTPDSFALLKGFAAGPVGARLTIEAAGSLERIQRR